MSETIIYPTRIIDADNVINYLGLSSDTETNVIDYIDTAISVAESEIESYCGQPIIPTDITVTFNGTGNNEYMFNHFPVLSISSLKYYENPLENPVVYTADVDYKIKKIDSVYFLYFANDFMLGGFYEAIIKVGYLKIPAEISHIGVEMCSNIIKQSDVLGGKGSGGRLGIQTINTSSLAGLGNVNITFKELFPRWEKVLNKYKRPIY